jgi:hypothetical protein
VSDDPKIPAQRVAGIFDPSASRFIINFRVDDLDAVLSALRAEYGRFGWVMDPEGNRPELWEPPRV